MAERRVLLAKIGRPHGVRGQVKLVSFTADARAIATYRPLFTEAGQELRLTRVTGETNPLIATIDGVSDRDAALRLTNASLYVERTQLPAAEDDEFYLADLEGLDAFDEAGNRIGRIAAIHDYGAGPWLEIQGAADDQDDWTIPFTRAAVPVVDLQARRVVIALPDEIEWRDEANSDEGEAA